MRFMPAIHARIFKPVPLVDAQVDNRSADPIARDLDAAVAEHERVSSEVRDDYEARTRETIDDLLSMIGKAR